LIGRRGGAIDLIWRDVMVRLSAIFLCEEERRGDGDGLMVYSLKIRLFHGLFGVDWVNLGQYL